ncbi:MAG: efflux RND transporter periplasmic adaptor subunit [Candidatus Pacebacteria bacterium]|nr:efflux RND transporter periplasmic adaptor subunit [Candidatus Paceibacterota bacterium]
MFGKFRQYVRAHKIISIVVVLALAGGGYYWYRSATATTTVTKYVVEDAAEGSVVVSVSGTGQVQAGTTIDVTPKVSEEVTSVAVKVGDKVSAGQLLVQLDSTNEQRTVNSAKLSLQSAQLALAQLQQVTTSTLLSDQNAVRQDTTSLATASTTLIQDYGNGFDGLGSVFVNLQTVMAGLQDFVMGNDISKTQNDPDAYVGLMPDYLQAGVTPYKNEVQASYAAADAAYEKSLADYHAASRSSDQQSLDALFSETGNTANTVGAAVKSSKDFITYIVNSYPASSSTKPLPTITTTLQNNFNTYTNTMTSVASTVQGTITGIVSDRNSIVNAQASLAQAQENLSELTAGPTDTQLLSAQINLQSAENSLTTAQQDLGYTSVRAPITGTVSAIGATVGQTAGSSAVTIVSDSEVAVVTLNEEDASKVLVGDPATLTFDAITDLSLAGKVVEVDPVGTVSAGVVSYNVQVGFSQPANTTSSLLVKPGMSVTADIVTESAQNVIAVANAAIVTQGSSTYILVPSVQLSTSSLQASAGTGIELTDAPKRVAVTTGLSNDTLTEVTSGINVGDQIIVKTVKSTGASKTTTTSTKTTSVTSLLTGGSRGGGGTPPSGGGGMP